jgi:hypothetical protein
MTSTLTPEDDLTTVSDNLARLLARRRELLPSADDAYVLSELTSIERQITSELIGGPAYDLAA